MRHSIALTLKVTRSHDLVAQKSNTSPKRHPVVERHLSYNYRKSRSLNTTVTIVFKTEIKLMLLSMPTLKINNCNKTTNTNRNI